MAQMSFKFWTRRDERWAGKLTIIAENEQEQMALNLFKRHIGNTQSGAKLDVLYPWRPQKQETKPEGQQ